MDRTFLRFRTVGTELQPRTLTVTGQYLSSGSWVQNCIPVQYNKVLKDVMRLFGEQEFGLDLKKFLVTPEFLIYFPVDASSSLDVD